MNKVFSFHQHTLLWFLIISSTTSAFTPQIYPHTQFRRNTGSLIPRHAAAFNSEQPIPSSAVVKVVESMSDGGSKGVIAADVAAAAGISLSQARKELTNLASISRGDIAVSAESAELIYSFPNDLSGVLASNSNEYKLRKIWSEQVWPKLFYGIRVSFGIALIASIFAIFSTIALISAGSSSDDDRRRDDRRDGMSFGYNSNPFGFGGIFGPSPFDFFYYRPYYGYYSRPYYQRISEDPEEMGFLESTFSYIFGDGNPNSDLQERRLQAAAEEIRRSGGAVTAEQLAPFVDVPEVQFSVDDFNDASNVDESYVLPIVSQLGGEPIVTDDGDIIYSFPDLQLSTRGLLERVGLPPSASSRVIKGFLQGQGIDTRGAIEKDDLIEMLSLVKSNNSRSESNRIVDESEIKFSVAGNVPKFFAGTLGVINLGGALYLGNMLATVTAAGVRLPGYYGVIQSAFPFLLSYAILYNVIPAARYAYIRQQNEKIKERNKNRRQWLTLLKSSTGRVARKLKAAEKLKRNIQRVDKESVAYDTQQDTSEISTRKELDALSDFDKLLES